MAKRFKQDVIIIGAGIGGLSTGAFLAQKGCKVRIFERLHQHGGFVHTFKRGEYTFEASTHCMSGFEHRYYLKNALKILKIRDLPLKYHKYAMEAIHYNGNSIKNRYLVGSGFTGLNEFVNRHFPAQASAISELMKDSRETSSSLLRIKRLQRDVPVKYIADLIGVICLKKSAKSPLLKKLAESRYSAIFRHKDKTGMDFLSEIRDPELRFVLTALAVFLCVRPEDCPAYMMAALYDLFLLNKPQSITGGTAVLLGKLVEKITENDGRIFYRSKVEKIIVKEGRAVGVRLTDGKVLYADKIICNNTVHNMFTELIDDSGKLLPPEYLRRIENYQPSPSAFQIYLGLPFRLEDYGFKAESTVFSSELDINKAIPVSQKLLNDNMAFIMTDYGKTNPEFYPEGKSGIVITRFDKIDNWKDLPRDKYKKKKEKTQAEILEKFQGITGIPVNKAEKIVAGTPKTMTFYSGDSFGGMIGADANLAQGALNRFDSVTPVKNLYIAGADVKPSGGVSASLDSGIITGRCVLKD